jgi:ArsR family transcriptional regulator, arsenate/arsenite/antimonite-responsive transcriptional repressor
MKVHKAVTALAALAHETRLTVFRLLMRCGGKGLPAGEIAERVGVPASTFSFHLRELKRAYLLHSWRRQRQIFYAADVEGTRELLTFLIHDSCQDHPESCSDLAHPAALLEEVRGADSERICLPASGPSGVTGTDGTLARTPEAAKSSLLAPYERESSVCL